MINNRNLRSPRPLVPLVFFSIFIIISAGLLIYSNSYDCGFHLDDQQFIVNNPDIGSIPDLIINGAVKTRIVGTITFSINYIWGGLDVFGYHLVNIFIHIFTALAAMWLAFLLFNSKLIENTRLRDNSLIASFFCGLLFLAHPVQTQAVTYIVQRQTELAALFYLVSVVMYIKSRQTEYPAYRVIFISVCLISSVLAMFSKENAVTVPLAFILTEILFIKKDKRDYTSPAFRTILIFSAIVVLSWTSYLIINRAAIFSPIQPDNVLYPPVNPLNYFITQLAVFPVYLRLLFFPLSQNLDYDFPVYSNIFSMAPLMGIFMHVIIISSAVLLNKEYKIISFGIFWFYLTMSIESSFLPIRDVIFEHRLYLPMFGFTFALTGGLFSLNGEKMRKAAFMGLAILAVAYSSLTYTRNNVWKTPETLWSDVLQKSPNKARPLNNYGNLLLSQGKTDEAMGYFEKALKANPVSSDANYNMGLALYKKGKVSEAREFLEKSLEGYQFNPLTLYALGNVYSDEGKWEKAVTAYEQAIYVKKGFTAAEQNIQIALLSYGDMLMSEGNANLAQICYKKILVFNPDFMVAYFRLANCYDSLKMHDLAIEYRNKAKELRDRE